MNHWLGVLFGLLLAGILLLEQFYLYRRVTRYLKEIKAKPWQVRAIPILFILFNSPIIIISAARPRLSTLPYWFILSGVMPFYIWHISSLFMFLFLMIGKIIKLPIATAVWAKRKILQNDKPVPEEVESFPYDPQRRIFLQRGIIVLTGVTFTGAMYGTFRRDNYDIVYQSIGVKNLPPEFNGFTITLVADIHSSMFMSKERMEEYKLVVNSLGSDLILVPGDFVTMSIEEVYPFAEAFEGLKAPYGVYGVLGNHDFYTRDVNTVVKEVNGCGIKLLRNENVTIQKNGSYFHLVGVDDIGTHDQADMAMTYALRGINDQVPKILMCHRPYFFDVAESKGIALTLSGHTHGGQIVFFKMGSTIIAPARIASPYVSGLYTINESNMYVNRGLGTVGIPVRLNCPPEITKITLRAV